MLVEFFQSTEFAELALGSLLMAILVGFVAFGNLLPDAAERRSRQIGKTCDLGRGQIACAAMLAAFDELQPESPKRKSFPRTPSLPTLTETADEILAEERPRRPPREYPRRTYSAPPAFDADDVGLTPLQTDLGTFSPPSSEDETETTEMQSVLRVPQTAPIPRRSQPCWKFAEPPPLPGRAYSDAAIAAAAVHAATATSSHLSPATLSPAPLIHQPAPARLSPLPVLHSLAVPSPMRIASLESLEQACCNGSSFDSNAEPSASVWMMAAAAAAAEAEAEEEGFASPLYDSEEEEEEEEDDGDREGWGGERDSATGDECTTPPPGEPLMARPQYGSGEGMKAF